MAIAIAMPGFNDLGRSVTPTFLSRNRFYLQLSPHCTNIGTQGVQELFFCEVSEIGAFMELFTVMIWLICQFFLVAMYSNKETGNL